MNPRNDAFVKLKPICVSLSQAILSWNGGKGPGNLNVVVDCLSSLLQALKDVSIFSNLDEKLADYVFFPISAALHQLEHLPIRAKELILAIILRLLETAWRSAINAQLGLQLIILITFMLDVGEGEFKQREGHDELESVCLQCLTRLFGSLQTSKEGKEALCAPAHVPQIGKTLSVILTYATSSATTDVQLAAFNTVASFYQAWPEQDSLSIQFFPGMVSSLSKLLSPKPSQRISAQSLIKAMKVLGDIIVGILGDETTKHLAGAEESIVSGGPLNQKWLNATSGQVKLALSNVMKLRNHSSSQVRHELASLCFQLLEACGTSLVSASEMLLESLSIVAVSDENVAANLTHMMLANTSLLTSMRSSLYNNVQALPRVMFSADDGLRTRSLAQSSLMLKLLYASGIDLSMITGMLATTIVDSVRNTIAPSGKFIQAIQSYSTDMHLARPGNVKFEAVLGATASQKRILQEVSTFLEGTSHLDCSSLLSKELMSTMWHGQKESQIASFWSCLELLRYAISSSSSDIIIIDEADDWVQQVLEELYAFSLDCLSTPDYELQDWRMQALSLECIVLQAQYHKSDFQSELVECLYPVVQCMGSSIAGFREHAITAVNLLAAHTGYTSSGQMIVANVDYMVNAVSLHLNTFELSPQAPQVLNMMVQLAGPPLLPYLDDVVDNIFTILDTYHGYQKLVDQLFEVLKSIAEQASAVPDLVLRRVACAADEKVIFTTPLASSSLRNQLGHRKARSRVDELADGEKDVPEVQAESIKLNGAIKQSQTVAFDDSVKIEDNASQSRSTSAAVGEANTKSHTLLLSIARLTEHYLTSSSLELRLKLLSLLRTVLPILARDEDTFLPLINTIWPVLVARLLDAEDYVVANVLDVIAILCFHAKGFMTSRIEESWHLVRQIGERASVSSSRAQPKFSTNLNLEGSVQGLIPISQAKSIPRDLSFWRSIATGPNIWVSFVQLLITVLKNVRTSDETADDMSNMLMPFARSNPAVHQVLRQVNSDAFWLHQWRTKITDKRTYEAALSVIKDLVTPETRNWQFAKA